MTQPGYSASRAGSGTSSVPESALNEATDVGKSAVERAGEVGGVVGEQVKQVASEAGTQARNLLDEGVGQLRDQARDGQRKLAEGLRDVAGQLRQMSDRSEDSGMATDLVRQATDRTERLASWLEEREPGDLVHELRRFARRRPGLFLLGATAAGVLAGRLTRNIVASAQDDGSDATPSGPARPGAESGWRSERPGSAGTTESLPSATPGAVPAEAAYQPVVPSGVTAGPVR
ncbi:MAG: hypothetical protein ACJ72N_17875 [Labedaea sp.]